MALISTNVAWSLGPLVTNEEKKVIEEQLAMHRKIVKAAETPPVSNQIPVWSRDTSGI